MIRNIMLFIFLFIFNNYAYSCVLSIKSTTSAVVDVGTVDLNSKAKIGDVIHSKLVRLSSVSDGVWDINCKENERVSYFRSAMNLPLYGRNVFRTNIQGVGLMVSLSSLKLQAKNKPLPDEFVVSSKGLSANNIYLKIDLVKTDSIIGSGKLLISNQDFLSFRDEHNSISTLTSLVITGDFIKPTCDILSDYIKVDFGNVDLSKLKKESIDGSDMRSFNVLLRCSAEHDLKVNFIAPGEIESNMVPIQKGEQFAQGIGIRIFYNSNIVKLNEPLFLSEPDRSGTDSSTEKLGFMAKITRNSDKLKPGPFVAHMTMSFEYR